MSTAEFDQNLIRLPLDYKGTPALAEIRVTVPSIVPPDVSNGEFAIGLELRDRWGFHLPKTERHTWSCLLEGAQVVKSRQPCQCCLSTIVTSRSARTCCREGQECFVCACTRP